MALNPFSAKDVLIDFTLSNARRFYSSKGNPLALKGLTAQTTQNPKLALSSSPRIRHIPSKTKSVTPQIFAFLAKVDQYLYAWQV